MHRHLIRTRPALLAIAALALLAPAGSAAFPGENGRIIMDHFHHGDFELMSLNPATGQYREVTDGSGDERAFDPSVSPDGQRITFVKAFIPRGEKRTRNDLFEISANGEDEVRLTDTEVKEGQPVYSPDGGAIAFKRGRDIYELDLETGEERVLSDHIKRRVFDPVYSPDGTEVAMSAFADGDRDILVVDAADGANPVNLTADFPGADRSPTYSPDGLTIAFVSDRAAGPADGIYLMNADGSDPRRLTKRPKLPETEPSFSPDGTLIAYNGVTHPDGHPRIFTIGVDGSDPRRIEGLLVNTSSPDWSVKVPEPYEPYDPDGPNNP